MVLSLLHICCILSAAYVIQNKVYINCQTSVSKMWRKIQFCNSVSHYKSLFHNSSLQAKICFLTACTCYSRVYVSSDSLFSKILKKPFMVHKKKIPNMNRLGFFLLRWSKKKIQNGRVSQLLWLWHKLKNRHKCIFGVFRVFLSLCQTASQPYRLSHANALCINQFY